MIPIGALLLMGIGYLIFAGLAGGIGLVAMDQIVPGLVSSVVLFVRTHPWESLLGVGMVILIVAGGFASYEGGDN